VVGINGCDSWNTCFTPFFDAVWIDYDHDINLQKVRNTRDLKNKQYKGISLGTHEIF